MKGYRTVIVAAVKLLAGILTMAGVVVTDETAAALSENIELVIGAVLAISGIVTGIMRAITDGPMGDKR